MGFRRALMYAAVAVTLSLTGCAASGDDGGSTTTTTTATDQPADGAVDPANTPISADALCAHLKKELPRIKAVGSEVGAGAQLTMSIATLYDDHLDQLDGYVVDAQAAKTCPDTRAELLTVTGLQSFGNL